MRDETSPERDDDKPLAGEAPTEEEQEELESGGNAAEVVESQHDDDEPAKPGAG